MNKKTVIDRVMDRLFLLKVSEAEFARGVGVSPQVWHNWKKRGTIPSNRISTVRDYLGISTDYLINDAHDSGAETKETRKPYITRDMRILEIYDRLSYLDENEISAVHTIVNAISNTKT